MKLVSCLVLVAAAAAGALARAQTPTQSGSTLPPPYVPPPIPYYDTYGAYGWGSHSTTPVEGFRRGMAEVIRAQGEYNLATSAAAVNWSEARRREIENDKFWTQTYFELRELNRQQHDAAIKRQRGNPEDYVRYARIGAPKPLSNRELDAVTGQIRWPILLTSIDLTPQRALLEKIFAARAYHGVLGAEDFCGAVRTIDQMSTVLADRITSVPPQEYLEARRFLRSLAYEARMPAG